MKLDDFYGQFDNKLKASEMPESVQDLAKNEPLFSDRNAQNGRFFPVLGIDSKRTTPVNISETAKIMRRERPTAAAWVFSKSYKGVDKWHNYRFLQLSMGGTLTAVQDIPNTVAKSQTAIAEAIQVMDFLKYNQPTFFVDAELFEAALNTTPPENLGVEELDFPFPTLAFMFPKNVMTYQGEAVPFLLISRIAKNAEIVGIRSLGITHEKPFIVEKITLILQTVFRNTMDGLTMKLVGKDFAENFKGLEDASYRAENDITRKGRLIKSDRELAQTLLKLAVNLLMIMNAEPKLIQTGRRLAAKKRGVGAGGDLFTPNVLGQNYRVQRERVKGSKGEHKSPRWHWRRGHWRRQGYGSKTSICQNCECDALFHAPRVQVEGEPAPVLPCSNCGCESFEKRVRFARYENKWIQPLIVNAKASDAANS